MPHDEKQSIGTRRLAHRRALIAIVVIVVAWAGRMPSASDDAISTPALACEGESPFLPATIQIPTELRADVEAMLTRSATFRRQCLRLADATSLRILVRKDLTLYQRSYRARSVIRFARSGRILVLVEIGPDGSPVEWIAHEFEHVLEQLDGVQLAALAGRSPLVWRSAEGMFETERAIRAGRTVVAEMRQRRRADSDKLVE